MTKGPEHPTARSAWSGACERSQLRAAGTGAQGRRVQGQQHEALGTSICLCTGLTGVVAHTQVTILVGVSTI